MVVTARMPTITASDWTMLMSGAQLIVVAAVDERQLVVVQRVQDQLDADEAEQDRQARGRGRPAA